MKTSEYEHDPDGAQKQFPHYGHTQFPIAISKRRHVQQEGKGWTEQECAPRRHVRMPALYISFAQGESMVS